MAGQFKIITESSCDLSRERLTALDVLVVPIPFTISGQPFRHFPDEREISSGDFYRKLASRAEIRTSAPSPGEFIQIAEKALREGQDLLYLGISSALSATFQAGVLAMRELQGKYPERDIRWVDTMSGAMGEALLVEMAANARKQGMGMQETIRLVEENRGKTAHIFTLDQLDYLRRSGRLPAFQAVLGSILDIKPILKLNAQGAFVLACKVRSYQKALARLYETVINKAVNLRQQIVYISHADVAQTAAQLADKIRSAGAKEVVVTLLGPAIAGHFGIGGIGVSFLAETR